MIRRHVLAALALGVDAGDEDVARGALAHIDWVLRGLARRRLEHALIDASLATGALDATDARLRLQAAALLVAEHAVDLTDAAAVARAYHALSLPSPTRWPVATTLAGIASGAVALTLAVAAMHVVTGSANARGFSRPPPPPAVGAFRDGGAPRRDDAIERVLSRDLPALLASSDDSERTRMLTALRTHAAFATHGPGLQQAWSALVASLDAWLDPDATARLGELRARVEVVSDQLAAAELGYYLEAAFGEKSRRRAGIYTYRIDEVGFVRAADNRIRVLGVRRLDGNDDGIAALGLTTDELDDPIVLVDQIEAKVARDVLPVLAGKSYALGDDAWRTPQGRAAMVAAGDGIRRELVVALGADLEAPDAAAARVRKLLTASVRHHEAQHGLDHDRDLRHPAVLEAAIGKPSNNAFALRARHELSAYLSQIASDMWTPQLTLWNLSRHALRGYRGRRVEEAFVAAIVVEQLALQLGIRPRGPVIAHGHLERDRLVELVAPLAARSTAELRSAAAAVWTRLYGERLPRIVDE